jgi:predicted acetyltransferase
MQITIEKAARDDKTVLENLMQFYQYEYSDLDQVDVDAHGKFYYGYLDRYWTEPDRIPMLVKVKGRWAGFVLLNSHTILSERSSTRAVAEFFIMRKYRKLGIGEWVAKQVFDSFPGVWEIQVSHSNPGGYHFWKRVLDRYTNGSYQETLLDDERWQGMIFVFESRNSKS